MDAIFLEEPTIKVQRKKQQVRHYILLLDLEELKQSESGGAKN